MYSSPYSPTYSQSLTSVIDNTVINPKTGRKIKINGPTYRKLLTEGWNPTNIHKSPLIYSPPIAQSQSPIIEDTIINPKTGRRITVNGPTYRKLIKEGYNLKNIPKTPRSTSRSLVKRTYISPAQFSDISNLPKVTSPAPLSSVYPTITSPALKRYTLGLMEKEGLGRGSATRGWAAVAPRRGPQRRQLKQKCGDACFLKPNTNSFPICPKLGIGNDCQVDCRGLMAAKIRANQYKYVDIANAADTLYNKFNC